MSHGFDTLLSRVETAARAIRANGYLNTLRDDETGAAVGFEVRFQPDPRFALWDGRRFGVSQRCEAADDVLAFLSAIEKAAAARESGISRDDPGTLEEILRAGVSYRVDPGR